MPELPWLQKPQWQMTYPHLLLSRQKCMDSTTAAELDLSNSNYNTLVFWDFFFKLQPSISESQIYTRLRQNRAKLHQLFLPSSCFSERIPITYTFFRSILLEVNSSRRTWVCPNSKASTFPLHSTIFCTSAQFRITTDQHQGCLFSHRDCLPIATTVFEEDLNPCLQQPGSSLAEPCHGIWFTAA